MNDNKSLVLVLIIAIVCLMGVVGFILLGRNNISNSEINESENNTASPKQICTQEAKICPNGSAVSRTGPNCEFAPCPQKK